MRRKKETTPGEFAILYALSDGTKRFGQLKMETGLTSRWLAKLLKRLQPSGKVTKVTLSTDSKEEHFEYELTSDARGKLEPTFKLLRAIKRKRRFIESDPSFFTDDHKSVDDAFGEVLASAVYFMPVLLAYYYHDDTLYEYLKEQGARAFEVAIESITKLSPASIRAYFEAEQKMDLSRLTLEGCIRKLPDMKPTPG